MSERAAKRAGPAPPVQGEEVLQRRCACGNHTLCGSVCAECGKHPSEADGDSQHPAMHSAWTIGASDDPLEDEADRVAHAVTSLASPLAVGAAPVKVRRAVASQGAPHEGFAPASVHRVVSGAGRPLEEGFRHDMEHGFGHDFSRVRVHTGADADRSTREVGAKAFTVGRDIVFGAGRFAPDTSDGRRLIAHELAHVLQQGSAMQAPGPAAPVRLQREPVRPEAPSGASTCPPTTLADRFTPTTDGADGGTVGANEFGMTSRARARVTFKACKEGGQWRFHLGSLQVGIASKLQPVGFRTEVSDATDAVVTKEAAGAIVADLRPNRTATFTHSCGGDEYSEDVTNYSRRRTYWKRQLVDEHETFHRKNWEGMYRAELVKGEDAVRKEALPEKDAATADEAVAKQRSVLGSHITGAYMSACKAYAPRQEIRAYDDGEPKYQALVDAITARARREKWIASRDGGGTGSGTTPDAQANVVQPSPHPGELMQPSGGAEGKMPLTPQVMQWVQTMRFGERDQDSADPETPPWNDPSHYPAAKQEGKHIVWGENDTRAVSINDVKQGALGDCYFMALLASIAQVRPEAIEEMVTPVGDGTFIVKFHGPDGKYIEKTVDATFPSLADGGPAYARFGDQSELYGRELWPMLIEKAWMQVRGGWLNMEGGKSDRKQHAIGMTGNVREDYPLPGKLNDNLLFDRLSKHHMARQPAMVFSPKADDGSLKKKAKKNDVILNHAYTLWNVHPSSKTLDLYNPHGPDSDHFLGKTAGFLRSSFRSVAFFTMGNVTLPAGTQGPTVEEQGVKEAEPQKILKDTGYDVVVAQFQKDFAALTTHMIARDTVGAFGTKLWELSTSRAQDTKKADADDRPLYWARLMALTFLRAVQPAGLRLTPVERNALIEILETTSRGRATIDFVSDATGLRRVLVSGFDTFGLGKGTWARANPSGAATLALDGRVVSGSPAGTDGKVEGVIFPVRYADFDDRIVETTFRPYLRDAKRRVDMIMTISQGGSSLDSSKPVDKQSEAFELERWAGRRRATSYPDNQRVNALQGGGTSVEGKRLTPGPEFHESSLPRTAMSGRGETAGESERVESGGKAVSGSGGDFLSNEIFYRTAQLRADEKSTVPVGHLHVPILPIPDGSQQRESEFLKQRDMIIDRVKTLIANALKSMGKKGP